MHMLVILPAPVLESLGLNLLLRGSTIMEASLQSRYFPSALMLLSVKPIGTELLGNFWLARESEAVLSKIKSLKEIYPGKKIIFGRDKIDQATGLLQKFKTFELFLQKYPEWQGKVVLVQVSSSPQSLPTLEKKISEVVSRINTTFGSLEFVPVHHFQQVIAREEYYGLLSIADVALITSVRDGMNTTSHEFVICQRSNYSPLILSEFTGTAGSLKEAMLVNPFDFSVILPFDVANKSRGLPKLSIRPWACPLSRKLQCIM